MASWRGTMYVLLITLVALTGTVCMLFPSSVFMLLHFPTFNRLRCWVEVQFFTVSSVLMTVFMGLKLVLHGDTEPWKGSALVISNHRTRLDWMFLWIFFLQQNALHSLKIVLKYGLKSVPGFGWGCQLFCFLFLQRKWHSDQAFMDKYLRHLGKNCNPYSLLLFPEGTDLSIPNRERDMEYASKMSYKVYQYVLHPRVTGFSASVHGLRNTGSLDNLIDMTIAYTGPMPQTEAIFKTGRFPQEVHVHVRKVDPATLPKTATGLNEWCMASFAQKEKDLCEFYTSRASSDMWNKPKYADFWSPSVLFSCLFWMFSCSLSLTMLLLSANFRYCAVFACLTMVLVSKMRGFDALEVSRFAPPPSE